MYIQLIYIKIVVNKEYIILEKFCMVRLNKKKKIVEGNEVLSLAYLNQNLPEPNFVSPLAQKLVWIPKRNVTCSFGALRLRAD